MSWGKRFVEVMNPAAGWQRTEAFPGDLEHTPPFAGAQEAQSSGIAPLCEKEGF
jgi:hypothetical protein